MLVKDLIAKLLEVDGDLPVEFRADSKGCIDACKLSQEYDGKKEVLVLSEY
jgi:hypothetical protein